VKIDRFGGYLSNIEQIETISRPNIIIYANKIQDQSASDNLRNLVKLRHEMEGQEDLFPLPFFFVEKKVFLGLAPKINWESMFCQHRRFLLNYYDIYRPKKYKNLLYDNEYKNIEHSKTLRPERAMLSERHYYLNKLILGTTLLPKSVVDYILDTMVGAKRIKSLVFEAWEAKKCQHCLQSLNLIRKRRTVERYLFLKYQTKTIDPEVQIAISKVWAHAWIDYLFYDTDLFYSIFQNKNYDLPSPPILYTFKSTDKDPMLLVNIHHAYIIRALYTGIREDWTGILQDRDWAVMDEALHGTIDEIKLLLIERQSKKMIMKIMENPKNWMIWLNLFDDENTYEETVPAEDKKGEPPSLNVTLKEISSVHKLDKPQFFGDDNDKMSPENDKRRVVDRKSRNVGLIIGHLVGAEFVIPETEEERREFDALDYAKERMMLAIKQERFATDLDQPLQTRTNRTGKHELTEPDQRFGGKSPRNFQMSDRKYK